MRAYLRPGACLSLRSAVSASPLVDHMSHLVADPLARFVAVDARHEQGVVGCLRGRPKPRRRARDLTRREATVRWSSVSTRLSTPSDKTWRRVQDANLTGLFLACKHGIPHLRATDPAGGSVI